MSALTFAIGDIHGRYDLLRRAAETIRKRANGRPATVILLGDYIDRGPRSREVVSFLSKLQQRRLAICLRGNHEAMLGRADHLRTPDAMSAWMSNGGAATLGSFGERSWAPSALDAVPIMQRRWLANLPLHHADRWRIYVHAGLAPEKPLDQLDDKDLLWIRERFLTAPAEAFKERRHIVHGHTPRWRGKPDAVKPELLEHRTNLDTGAFATGVLTIGVFADGEPGGPVNVLSVR